MSNKLCRVCEMVKIFLLCRLFGSYVPIAEKEESAFCVYQVFIWSSMWVLLELGAFQVKPYSSVWVSRCWWGLIIHRVCSCLAFGKEVIASGDSADDLRLKLIKALFTLIVCHKKAIGFINLELIVYMRCRFLIETTMSV